MRVIYLKVHKMKNPFRKRTKTFVDSQTVKIFEDDFTAPTIIESIIKSIVKDTPVVDEITEYIKKGSDAQFRAFYKYGAERHIDGVPLGGEVKLNDRLEVFNNYLRGIYGNDITIAYSTLGPLDFIHFAQQKLQDDFNYNRKTNEIVNLSSQVNNTVKVEGFKLLITSEVLEKSDVTLLTYLTDTVNDRSSNTTATTSASVLKYLKNFEIVESTEIAVEVIYSYKIANSDPNKFLESTTEFGTLKFAVPYQIDEADDDGYFQAIITRSNGEVVLFTYKQDSGLYPVLDNIFDTNMPTNYSHYPIVMLVDNQNIIASPGSKVTDSSSSWFNPTTMANASAAARRREEDSRKLLNKLGMNLKTLTEGLLDNPEIAKVRQCALMVACPIKSNSYYHKRYLFSYFNKYVTTAREAALSGIYWKSGTYEAFMNHSGITRKTVTAANASSMEDYTMETVPRTVTTQYQDTEGGTHTSSTTYYDLVLRKKISRIGYQEIRVKSPVMQVKVTENRYASHDAQSEHFLIPIERELAEAFGSNFQKELLIHSLHFQVSVLETVQVKWYQTRSFGIFLKIVAIAITIVSLGSAASSLTVAFSSGLWAGVAAIAKIILFSIIIKAGAEYAVNKWGPKNTFLAVLAAVLVMYATGVPLQIGSIPVAENYLTLATNLIQWVSSATDTYVEKMLQEGYAELSELQTQADEELKKIQEEFLPHLLSENHYMVPLIINGETPDELYNRTVHSSNPGIQAIEGIYNFVDTALTLPEANYSIMRIQNA